MATYKIKDYTVGPTEEFFFDTNVWMLLFAPLAGSKKNEQRAYSSFLGDIITRGATIWINSQVIAEYVNKSLRMEFEAWKKREAKYGADFKKDFRPTAEYATTLKDTENQVSAILQKCTKGPDDFHTVEVVKLISSMAHNYDYGDAVIIDFCQRKKIKLVTDDSDITKLEFSFPVITA